MIHFQLHSGQCPRVSKVFQVAPQPPICGAHSHRLDGVGLHRNFGQKISGLCGCPSNPVIVFRRPITPPPPLLILQAMDQQIPRPK
jgi:hypothetical protein